MIPKYVRPMCARFLLLLCSCVRCAPFDRYSLCYRYSLLLWLVKFKSLIIIRQNMDDDDKSTTEQQDTQKKKSRAPLITCIAILYDTQQTTETATTTKIGTENKIKANTCRENEAPAATKKKHSARWRKRTDDHISVIYCIFLLIK